MLKAILVMAIFFSSTTASAEEVVSAGFTIDQASGTYDFDAACSTPLDGLDWSRINGNLAGDSFKDGDRVCRATEQTHNLVIIACQLVGSTGTELRIYTASRLKCFGFLGRYSKVAKNLGLIRSKK